ncbi:class I SAM-dependent methyltransferase [Sediminibacterium sp.]|uniref:class I SAM-dependent methyltransferase n=1 Tax=Sediminibacterium sp. TaxID=1917865 RepID=UPI0027352380|nr:class I SAM-dependent methyltransferase [Sediminibacterium sp.]MDP3392411.1 class I SAM-dependent methyltransferase [Sediminibacterium sp.]MDP3565677.1 class I SAM-dependent methyltransferase [Sediminibacterium sp.]
MDNIEEFFSGKKLYGDDFTIDQIKSWYSAEEEGYAELVKKKSKSSKDDYRYIYNSMNIVFGFGYIDKNRRFSNALGFGSAFGHEFFPVIDQIDKLTIIEPSEYLISKTLGHLQPKYVKPEISGKLSFEDNSFDFITCFSALHHVPNVGFVLSELTRVLKPDGIMIIREPIRTMGDWRYVRNGLTKNERGIPYQYFDAFFDEKKLEVIKKTYCDSNFAYQIISKFLPIKRDSILYQKFDKVISKIFSFNIHYHANNSFKKLAPASVFYVLKKGYN